jgi:hypothetical protein
MVLYDDTDWTVQRHGAVGPLAGAQQAVETLFPPLDAAAATADPPQRKPQKLVRKKLVCACGHVSRWEVMREDADVGTLDCDARCAADGRRQQLADAFDRIADAPPSFLQCKAIDWPLKLVLVRVNLFLKPL